MILTSWSRHITIMLTHYQMMNAIIHFSHCKMDYFRPIYSKIHVELKRHEMPSTTSNRKAVVVWVSPVAAKRACSIIILSI